MLETEKSDYVDNIIANSKNPELHARYAAYLSLDNKLRSNIQVSALSCLSIFTDPKLQRVTSHDTLQLDVLQARKDNYALFIQCDTLDSSYYNVLTSLLIHRIITSLYERVPESGRRCLMLLDEFPAISAIPDIDVVVSTCRKYLCNMAFFIQSYSQLESRYNQKIAQTIRTNCTARLYFTAGLDYETSYSLQQELGKFSHALDGRQTSRELKLASELRQTSSDRALLLYSNMPGTMVNLRPYYLQPLIMKDLQDNYFDLTGELPENIPFI